jgi:hypothetical protein
MDNAANSHMGEGSPSAQDEPSPRATPGKPLSEAARRALAEAAERRADIDRRAAEIGAAPEQNGRGGLEPVRYQDWEIGGRAIDF